VHVRLAPHSQSFTLSFVLYPLPSAPVPSTLSPLYPLPSASTVSPLPSTLSPLYPQPPVLSTISPLYPPSPSLYTLLSVLPSQISKYSPIGLSVNAAETSVTLVCTDVEGSTEMWEWDNKAMMDAISLHDRVMRMHLPKFGGYEVATEGDAFVIAFHTPGKAVGWAAATQQVTDW